MTGRYAEAARSYGGAAVVTATPLDLCVLLGERALRDLDTAADALRRQDQAEALKARDHARAVVVELLAMVDREGGGAPADRLAGLYVFAIRQLGGPPAPRTFADLREVLGEVVDGFRALRRGVREVA